MEGILKHSFNPHTLIPLITEALPMLAEIFASIKCFLGTSKDYESDDKYIKKVLVTATS